MKEGKQKQKLSGLLKTAGLNKVNNLIMSCPLDFVTCLVSTSHLQTNPAAAPKGVLALTIIFLLHI